MSVNLLEWTKRDGFVDGDAAWIWTGNPFEVVKVKADHSDAAFKLAVLGDGTYVPVASCPHLKAAKKIAESLAAAIYEDLLAED